MANKTFTINDLQLSTTAKTKGIDNTIPTHLRRNAYYITCVLNQLLQECDFTLTSGYRCPELNKLVGGVKNSKHIECLAVDIVPANVTLDQFKNLLEIRNRYYYDIDKILMYPNKNYLHVSFKKL